ncbi:MAG TPA: porin family protein [Mucilaginibacter sp.]
MIKKLVVTVFFITACCLFVQAQILYGIKVSGGIATQHIDEFDISSTSLITTFNASGVVELPVKYGFWLQSGLGVTNKGSVLHDGALSTTTHLTYIELPLNVLRKFTFTDIGKFYIGAGGYIADGQNGHFDYLTPSSSSTEYVRFGNDNDFRKIDAGLNFLTGFELNNKLTFDVQYSFGLNNIASDPQKNTGITNIRNRLFSLGLGYLFK